MDRSKPWIATVSIVMLLALERHDNGVRLGNGFKRTTRSVLASSLATRSKIVATFACRQTIVACRNTYTRLECAALFMAAWSTCCRRRVLHGLVTCAPSMLLASLVADVTTAVEVVESFIVVAIIRCAIIVTF